MSTFHPTYNKQKQKYINIKSIKFQEYIRNFQRLFFSYMKKLFHYVDKIFLVKYERNTFFDVNHHVFGEKIRSFRAFRKKHKKTIVDINRITNAIR